MVCEHAEKSISIYFPNSGIEISPYESDIRDRRRKFAVGKFEISREAGELLSENVPDDSPAIVRIGGTDSRRLRYTKDGLNFERTLHDEDIAELTLDDATKVLTRGSITKNFRDVTLRTVVRYILNQSDDPYDIITSMEYISGANPDRRDAPLSPFNIGDAPSGPSFSPILESDIPHLSDAAAWLEQGYRNVQEGLFGDVYTGFIFNEVTPLEALRRVMDEFELDWWVTTDGVLKIGIDGTVGQIIGVVDDNDTITLSRYAITTDPDTVRSVTFEGPYIPLPSRERALSTTPERASKELLPISEAVNTESSGSETIRRGFKSGIGSLEELENKAERALLRATMQSTSGSIEINALASEDTDALARLTIGDLISIGEGVDLACNKNLVTGVFVVTGLDHKSNSRTGWTISLEVSKILTDDQIETRSVFYDPQADKQYDSIEHYKEATGTEGEMEWQN